MEIPTQNFPIVWNVEHICSSAGRNPAFPVWEQLWDTSISSSLEVDMGLHNL